MSEATSRVVKKALLKAAHARVQFKAAGGVVTRCPSGAAETSSATFKGQTKGYGWKRAEKAWLTREGW